jgi:hypothetical protein
MPAGCRSLMSHFDPLLSFGPSTQVTSIRRLLPMAACAPIATGAVST